jgi:hypothetical protein
LALAGLVVMFVSGSASAAGNKKLVEGTVYDATCATVCQPECPPPPHCGPITAQRENRIVCPMAERRMIACPLSRTSTVVCVQAEGCPGTVYPVYSGEGAVVNVRKRGSPTAIATLQVTEGHFQIRLGPGEYVLQPYLPDEACWSGEPDRVTVTARVQGPIPASVDVADRCVAHPDAQ